MRCTVLYEVNLQMEHVRTDAPTSQRIVSCRFNLDDDSSIFVNLPEFIITMYIKVAISLLSVPIAL